MPWAVAAGTLFLGGLVAIGLWWNQQQALPPPVGTQPPAAPAPERSAELPPAPAGPAEAARPSAELEPDAGEDEEPTSAGMILHRPSGAPEPPISAPTRMPKRLRGRPAAAPERTSEAPAPARDRSSSKTRSGASVSVDDF
jgi:hypothetical protein